MWYLQFGIHRDFGISWLIWSAVFLKCEETFLRKCQYIKRASRTYLATTAFSAQAARENWLLPPSNFPIEKASWTLGNLWMSISPQRRDVEKMLMHHFEAETQGFQGLVDQNDGGKAWVTEKSILYENIFVFDLAGGHPTFLEINQNILKYIWP